MDIAGALTGLLLLAPVFAIVAAAIKLGSPGAVFFKHRRYGWSGRQFDVWKFRTMHESVDPDHHRAHLANLMNGQATLAKLPDDHLIPCGRWLRSTAIDELPQLLNVLWGEMSLVGPRPDVIPPDEYKSWQSVRFQVAPGMTGLWQVSGKNKTTFEEMLQYDVRYVEHRSLWLDLKILLLTPLAIAGIVFDDFQAPSPDGKPRATAELGETVHQPISTRDD